MKLADYVAEGGNALSDDDVRAFRRGEIPALTAKMSVTEGERDGKLFRMTQFLLRVASEYDDFRRSAMVSEVTREAVFVLQYFLDEDDAIPDDVEGLGLSDDWMVGRAMLRRHESELREFADACGHRWGW